MPGVVHAFGHVVNISARPSVVVVCRSRGLFKERTMVRNDPFAYVPRRLIDQHDVVVNRKVVEDDRNLLHFFLQRERTVLQSSSLHFAVNVVSLGQISLDIEDGICHGKQ